MARRIKGRSKQDKSREVWRKSSGLCAHCGKPSTGSDRTIDHVIPQILGGGNDPRNLMPLCRHCNASRASGEIIPERYYIYAAPWALDELWSYIREWKAAHTTAAGTLTVDRYGIIEREVPRAGDAAGSPANSSSG